MEQQTRMMEQMAITNQELQRQTQQQQQQNQQLMGLLARLSPPGLALGEQQPAVAPQAPQVEVEYLKKIPDHIQKQLTHFMQDFEKSMAKITRTRVTIEKLSNDVQVLNDKVNRRYPPGCRAFKTSETETELDNVLKGCVDQDSSLAIVLPRGSSRREAMRIIHHETTLFFKQVQLEAKEELREVLKVAGSKDTFVQEGTKIMQSVTDDRGASLGLDSTRSKPFDPKFVETKLDSMWHQMVDKEAKKEEQRKK
eukprot:2203132-Pyramimonas_sp.AAC.1